MSVFDFDHPWTDFEAKLFNLITDTYDLSFSQRLKVTAQMLEQLEQILNHLTPPKEF